MGKAGVPNNDRRPPRLCLLPTHGRALTPPASIGRTPPPVGDVGAARQLQAETFLFLDFLGPSQPPESPSGARRVHVRCSSRARRCSLSPISFSQTDLRSPSTF